MQAVLKNAGIAPKNRLYVNTKIGALILYRHLPAQGQLLE
jgi:hypothetical protein